MEYLSQSFKKLKIEGENKAIEYNVDGVNNIFVALFFALVRNIPDYRLEEMVNRMCLIANESKKEYLCDLFVLIFQTRDCRGGKGERNIFYKMLLQVYSYFPIIVENLIPLIAEYGCYRDYFTILEKNKCETLKNLIINFLYEQIIKDYSLKKTKVSILAKWMPREGHKWAKKNPILFSLLTDKFVSSNELNLSINDVKNARRATYRRIIRELTNVVETQMCANEFDKIKHEQTPSVALNKYRKAFANEHLKIPPSYHQELTGNRHPTDPKRIICRQNLKMVLSTKKINGMQLDIHKLIANVLQTSYPYSIMENNIAANQWTTIKENVIESFTTIQSDAINLGKLLPLIDVSGSMRGVALEVAIGIGMLVSELSINVFKNKFITFHETPSWGLITGDNFYDRVLSIKNTNWGSSTNFIAVFDMILDKIIEYNLTQDQIPDLLVLSDMQFNQADKELTTFEVIQNKFLSIGFLPPRLIFWNLRGNTDGFPVQSTTENTIMISGYSPALLKSILSGNSLNNSTNTFRKIMDDKRYDMIRDIVNIYL